uniref:Transposase Tc1-like domain-containing protein n=1 Tax=Esox lucius TaxID=8010 RepID=A0AAY5KHY5_ESOLU
MAHPYVPLQEGLLYLTVQSQEHAGDTRRRAVTQGELNRAVEGHQPSSRTSICSIVREGTVTARALHNVLQRATGVHFSDQTVRNRLHEGGIRARHPLVGLVLTAQHCAVWLAFSREQQNWQVCHWCPVLLTEQVHTEHTIDLKESAMVNVMLPATSSSMTCLAVGQ